MDRSSRSDSHYFGVTGFTGIDVYAWNSQNLVLTPIASITNSQGSCVQNQGCTGTGYGNLAWDHYGHLYTTFGNPLQVYSVPAAE